MNKQERDQYKDRKAVAVFPMTNFGGIEILDIIYGIDDYVVYRFNFGEPKEAHKAKIRYGTNYDSFRTYAGYTIRLDECLRVG